MRYLLPLIEIAILLFGGAKPPAIPVGVVTRAVDGDTLKVEIAGIPTTVRISGIDAPELKQPGGMESRDALAEMAAGQRVQVLEVERDRYGRTVAHVWLRGQSLGQVMLRDGWAWSYDEHEAKGYQKIEDVAHAARLGIWGRRAVPIEPWVWRRSH